MSSLERDKFIIATFQLSRSAPQAWREFESVFAAYVSHQIEDAIRAPATHALTAHGVAQAYLALRDDFQKLEQTYALIEQKLKNKQSR
jgi:hypothetical protein